MYSYIYMCEWTWLHKTSIYIPILWARHKVVVVNHLYYINGCSIQRTKQKHDNNKTPKKYDYEHISWYSNKVITTSLSNTCVHFAVIQKLLFSHKSSEKQWFVILQNTYYFRKHRITKINNYNPQIFVLVEFFFRTDIFFRQTNFPNYGGVCVFINYLCPLKTSCDSSITFHTLRVLSLAPAVTGRSLDKQSIPVTVSWWPNLHTNTHNMNILESITFIKSWRVFICLLVKFNSNITRDLISRIHCLRNKNFAKHWY